MKSGKRVKVLAEIAKEGYETELIQLAKAQMNKENKQQWDESYPAAEHIAADIENNYIYVLCIENKAIAYNSNSKITFAVISNHL